MVRQRQIMNTALCLFREGKKENRNSKQTLSESEELVNEENSVLRQGCMAVLLKQVTAFRIKKESFSISYPLLTVFASNASI